jgi:hypothetical protein
MVYHAVIALQDLGVAPPHSYFLRYRLARVAASRTSWVVTTGWLLASSGLSKVTIVAGSAATVRIATVRSSFSIAFDLRSA